MPTWTPCTPAITPPREASYEREHEHQAGPAPAGAAAPAHRQVARDPGPGAGRGRRAACRGGARDTVLPVGAGLRLARDLDVPVRRPEDGRRPPARPFLEHRRPGTGPVRGDVLDGPAWHHVLDSA